VSTEVAVAVLTKARDLVQDGWVQHRAYNTDHTSRCAGQALQDAFHSISGDKSIVICPCYGCVGHSSNESKGFYLASETFQEVIHSASIPNWTDETGRTQRQVVEAFTQAIERLSPPGVTVVVPEAKPITRIVPEDGPVIPVEKIVVDGHFE
jgi:hypothetical protein